VDLHPASGSSSRVTPRQTRIDRVQNVNTSQSIRQRLLRVGTVDFDTAGSDDSEFRFLGIGRPEQVVAAVEIGAPDRPSVPGAACLQVVVVEHARSAIRSVGFAHVRLCELARWWFDQAG
jgi:hypothetical protein